MEGTLDRGCGRSGSCAHRAGLSGRSVPRIKEKVVRPSRWEAASLACGPLG